jgi:hypothetical protein
LPSSSKVPKELGAEAVVVSDKRESLSKGYGKLDESR